MKKKDWIKVFIIICIFIFCFIGIYVANIKYINHNTENNNHIQITVAPVEVTTAIKATPTIKPTPTLNPIPTEKIIQTEEETIISSNLIETEENIETSYNEEESIEDFYNEEENTETYVESTTESNTEESNESTGETYYGNCTVTFYCGCAECCGQWAGGPTASGVMPSPNWTVANGSLPFGTIVYIEGLGTYCVEDRGVGAYSFDIYVNNHDQIPSWGMGNFDVYIVN